ncbi:hypothetical protein bcgnr5378_06330 [Bacillus cereus]
MEIYTGMKTIERIQKHWMCQHGDEDPFNSRYKIVDDVLMFMSDEISKPASANLLTVNDLLCGEFVDYIEQGD